MIPINQRNLRWHCNKKVEANANPRQDTLFIVLVQVSYFLACMKVYVQTILDFCTSSAEANFWINRDPQIYERSKRYRHIQYGNAAISIIVPTAASKKDKVQGNQEQSVQAYPTMTRAWLEQFRDSVLCLLHADTIIHGSLGVVHTIHEHTRGTKAWSPAASLFKKNTITWPPEHAAAVGLVHNWEQQIG